MRYFSLKPLSKTISGLASIAYMKLWNNVWMIPGKLMSYPTSRCVTKMANGLPWTTGACGCLDNSRWRGDSPEYPSTSPTPSPSANITQRMVAHLWRFWNGENDSIWQPWFLNLNTCVNFKKLVHFVSWFADFYYLFMLFLRKEDTVHCILTLLTLPTTCI